MLRQFFLVITAIVIGSVQMNAQAQFWGTTSKGGEYGAGTIFRTDGTGNNPVVSHSFFQIEGHQPHYAKLLEGTDGKLYGVTNYKGKFDLGVLYQYDPVTGVYVNKFDFDGVLNGAHPQGSLMQATDGLIYGMTWGGGSFGLGVLFRFDPVTGIFTKLIDFSGTANGANPRGHLLQASDGMMYGVTQGGGTVGAGVLFRFNPVTAVLTVQTNFMGISNGSQPLSGLIQALDGMLYGVTCNGGTYNDGVLFQFNPVTSVYFKMRDFAAPSHGEAPQATLVQLPNGRFYGTATTGGGLGSGCIYEFSLVDSSITIRANFTSGLNGSGPKTALLLASDGMMYGTAVSGGLGAQGTLFRFDPTTFALTNLRNFTTGASGCGPYGYLMQATNGLLYGLTVDGGSVLNHNGVMYSYNISTSTYTKILDFGQAPTGNSPERGLMTASNGKFYGMARLGGRFYNHGVIYEYDAATNVFDTIKNFDDVLSGRDPQGLLTESYDGFLYGVTRQGGVNSFGVLFQIDPVTHAFVKKHDFSASTGIAPSGSLVVGADNLLYGVAGSGGANNQGALFRYDPATSVYSLIYSFSTAVSGRDPLGSLCLAPDGFFYGATNGGGANGLGTIYRFNPITLALTVVYHFSTGSGGYGEVDHLIPSQNGKMYGMTNSGGLNNMGVIFSFNPVTLTYTPEFHFDGVAHGAYPNGSLMEASDNNLYGMTARGGTLDYGTMFRFDPVSGICTRLTDFTGLNGQSPRFSSLLEAPVNIQLSVSDTFYCPGDTFTIGYTLSGAFNSGNVFTAQLSDGNGSFFQPITIGAITSSVPGSLLCTLPANSLHGTGYRIRISSSTPLLSGADNGFDLTISNPLTVTVSDSVICLGDTAGIFASGMDSYSWLPIASTSDSVFVMPSVYTQYTLTATDSSTGCVLHDTVGIVVNQLPNVMVAANDTTLCIYDSVLLVGSGADTYLWPAFSFSGDSLVDAPVVTTVYLLLGTDTNGCVDSAQISVQILSLPVINVSASDTSLCQGQSVTLFASGGHDYSWLPGNDTTTQVTDTLLTTVTYSVSGSDTITGCSSLSVLTIVVFSIPQLSATIDNVAGCNQSNGSLTGAVINGTPPYSTEWTPGNVTTLNYSGIAFGSYVLVVNDSVGCTDTLTIALGDSCAFVWPGDANEDGTADNLDILAIGIANDSTGVARVNPTTVWIGQDAIDWNQNFASGVNFKYADCDGNGLVEPADTTAVILNYGLTHIMRSSNPAWQVSAPELSVVISDDTIGSGMAAFMDIYLGSASTVSDSTYGVAFTINFDPYLIDQTSLNIDMSGSWIDSQGNMIGVLLNSTQFPGTAQIGITRLNHTDTSGYGFLCRIYFETTDSLTGTGTSALSFISLSNPVLQSSSQILLPVNAALDSMFIIDSLVYVGVPETNLPSVNIYPNPTSGESFVVFPSEYNGQQLQLKIYDPSGRVVFANSVIAGQSNVLFADGFASGIYLVEAVFSDNTRAVVRWIIE